MKWLFPGGWDLGGHVWRGAGKSFISTLVDDHIASLHKSNRVGKVVFVHKLSGGAQEVTRRHPVAPPPESLLGSSFVLRFPISSSGEGKGMKT